MGQKILIVDDSRTICKVVEWVFHASPYTVVAAHSADEALTAMRSERFAAAIIDYWLPDRTGFDLVNTIRGDALLREIPLLMLGGNFHPFDEIDVERAGADGFIMKPFKTDDLMDGVSRAISAAAQRPVKLTPPDSLSADTDDDDFYALPSREGRGLPSTESLDLSPGAAALALAGDDVDDPTAQSAPGQGFRRVQPPSTPAPVRRTLQETTEAEAIDDDALILEPAEAGQDEASPAEALLADALSDSPPSDDQRSDEGTKPPALPDATSRPKTHRIDLETVPLRRPLGPPGPKSIRRPSELPERRPLAPAPPMGLRRRPGRPSGDNEDVQEPTSSDTPIARSPLVTPAPNTDPDSYGALRSESANDEAAAPEIPAQDPPPTAATDPADTAGPGRTVSAPAVRDRADDEPAVNLDPEQVAAAVKDALREILPGIVKEVLTTTLRQVGAKLDQYARQRVDTFVENELPELAQKAISAQLDALADD